MTSRRGKLEIGPTQLPYYPNTRISCFQSLSFLSLSNSIVHIQLPVDIEFALTQNNEREMLKLQSAILALLLLAEKRLHKTWEFSSYYN